MFSDFLALIYPRNCVACGNNLFKHEEQVCNKCYINLPKTNFHKQNNNPVASLFYGRVNLELASSFYLFQKKGGIQQMLHSIKYKSNTELATLIGNWYAKDLIENDVIATVNAIIPVPLHVQKLKQRGFNQSEEFARGLAQGLNVELNTTTLLRKDFTETQTKKNKFERWQNVEDVFELKQIEALENKHLLVVDDVVTTGATIEACCQTLLQIPNIKLSVLSIAYADM